MSDPITRLNAALEGRYRIESELGEGGMATVYLAEDIKHERKVALKVLKPELAAVVGAERFLAEIKTTANLTHPNILPLHDSGEADSFVFYVMPYVEGESLRDRIDREKQLPVDEAVRIATAVANALHHAHEKGVIHRDIKPANILIQDGEPLIADFGIALAIGAGGSSRLTETGLSLGTPYYMSPEQATGDQTTGPATDTYALGCVLYETLVGDPPYMGSTAQAVLGKIIMGEAVSATKTRSSVPSNVDAAIRKALEKLQADRFKSAQDFAKALENEHFRHGELASAGGGGVAAGPWNRLTVAVTALAAAFAVAFGWSVLGPDAPELVARFPTPFAEGQRPLVGGIAAGMALTADGSALVYTGPGALWIRRWADLDATPIRGTEGGGSPVLSPDEREVAFMAGNAVRAAPLDGGPSRTLVEGSRQGVWDWTSDGFVYFTQARPSTGLARVPSTGGGSETVEILTELREGEFMHGWFSVLPGGTMGVFQVLRSLDGEGSEIWALDLDTHDRRFLTDGNTPVYASSGHLLFGTPDGVLMAAPFDPATAELTGPAVPVMEDLALTGVGRVMSYAVSESGTLMYLSGDGDMDAGGLWEPVWVTRSGDYAAIDGSLAGWRVDFPNAYVTWRLSPDGGKVAVGTGNGIWVKQLPDGPFDRLTFDTGVQFYPAWSPDGQYLTYSQGGVTQPDYDVWRRRADGTGTPELLLGGELSHFQSRWSPDGEWIVVRAGFLGRAPGERDIWGFRRPRPGVDSEVIPLIATAEFAEQDPAFSPDGNWLAYTSDRTDRNEVYVSPFPNVESGPRVAVSTNGGSSALWAHSGSELFFLDAGRNLVTAKVETASGFRVLDRETLFTLGPEYLVSEGSDFYDVAPDDQRFLMARLATESDGSSGGARFILVLNWFTELRERMGGN